MKIVMISDTHNYKIPHDELPEGDILIHSGDATSMGYQHEIQQFCDYLSDPRIQEKYKEIIFVPGNHDLSFDSDYTPLFDPKEMLEEIGVKVLVNDLITFEGLRIYGSPITPEFCNWAFMKNDEWRRVHWLTIPTNLDILITHGPAHGILDECIDGYTRQMKNCGCEHLKQYVIDEKPKLHVFGHIHPSNGIFVTPNTTFVNASIMNDNYCPVNAPKVIELGD